jgi:hypothetical protein
MTRLEREWKNSYRLIWPVLGPCAVMLSLFGQFAIPASADHDDLIDPDNADHHVDRNDLGASANNATIHGIGQIDRTKMNATLSGSGDVEVFDYSYGSSGSWKNTRGRTTCVNKTWTGRECDVYEVSFNLTYLSGSSSAVWNHVGCHEFGHTGGLGHRTSSTDSNNNSCMRSGGANQYFDDHDIDQIDEDV